MRIAMLSPLEMRTPPLGYGGIELVVSLLTEELVRRGYDVTLFASGDSITNARLAPGSPAFLRGTDHNKSLLTLMSVADCLERADEFDIIHSHVNLETLALAGLAATPVLTTLHGHLDGDWLRLFEFYKGWYSTVSYAAKSLLPEKERFVGVIYNAIDHAAYPFNPGPREDYLLFLSRISREKGAHLAIEVAKRLGRRLIMAGNVDSIDKEYFNLEVLPHIDNRLIIYAGEADQKLKCELFSKARCLLAPLNWPEPFGLFMIEAQVCGTPVVALNCGSAPEVVSHGVTGLVVDSIDEMACAVGQVDQISPAACRAFVEENFTVDIMTDNYLAAYEKITGRKKPAGRTPTVA